MIELRVLAITGLLVTMGLVTVAVVGAHALGRWLRSAWESLFHRLPLDKPAPRDVLRIRTHPISADAERRVRDRQAAWRLRC
jgi:uncharacterized membrane protein